VSSARSFAAIAFLFGALGAVYMSRARGLDLPGDGSSTTPIDLEVEATGFDDERGHAMGLLFRPGANVLDRQAAFVLVTSAIDRGSARLFFPALAEGTYALVVFHDSNDNGSVDHNLFRLPSEQLGFSSGFRPGVIAGMPTFEKLQFRLARPNGGGPVLMRVVVM